MLLHDLCPACHTPLSEENARQCSSSSIRPAFICPTCRAESCLNVVSDSDEAFIRDAFGEETRERLAAVKAAYDPDRVFAYNPNNRTAAATGAA
jgi:hypothetical protein